MVRPRGGFLKVGILIAVAMVAYPPWDMVWYDMNPIWSSGRWSSGTIYGPIWWLARDPEKKMLDVRLASPLLSPTAPLRDISDTPHFDYNRTIGMLILGVYGIDSDRLLFQLFCLALMMQIIALSTQRAAALPAQDPTPADGIDARLQRLEDFKEKGLLTAAEFQAGREEILGEV